MLNVLDNRVALKAFPARGAVARAGDPDAGQILIFKTDIEEIVPAIFWDHLGGGDFVLLPDNVPPFVVASNVIVYAMNTTSALMVTSASILDNTYGLSVDVQSTPLLLKENLSNW